MKLIYTFLFLLSFGFSFGQVNYLKENFDYTAGTNLTVNGWTAHSDGGVLPVKVSSSGLTWTGYIGSGIGNAAVVAPTNATAEDVNNRIAGDITNGALYTSFLVNRSTTAFSNAPFLHLSSYSNIQEPNLTGISSERARVWATVGTTGPKFKLGLTFSSLTFANVIFTGDLDEGTTYLVVLKYQFVDGPNNDTVSLYVFPEGADISTEPATPSIGPLTATVADGVAIQNVALRQANASQGTTVDGIVVRTVWDLTSAGQDISTGWDGNSSTPDTDWANSGNWTHGVPISGSNVLIPSGLTNFPTIPTGTSVTTNNITIESGATLVTQGTSTVSGNVTYRRNITHTSGNLEGWHLIGAPVTGQAYNATYVTDNSIASSGNNRGIATYNNAVATGNWTYLQSDGSGTFTKGTGYSVKTSTTRDISFSGSLHTSDPELVGITVGAGTPFNLISNPFAAFVNAKTFLDVTANADKLTSKTIWVWNPTTKNYETKLAGDPQEFLIAPGQGFFVSCSTAGNLEFAKSNQVHSGTETFLKSAPVTEIVLKMTADTDERFAKIRYQNEATTSFDNGYDGETFSGVANSVDVFTQLIENTTDKKYQIQAIPNSNYENMVIPVGVFSSTSKEVTLTVDANNIPDGYHVYLEDRKNNVVTVLSDANTSYKTTVESGESLGRFFIHMKTSSVLSSATTELTGITMYKSNTDLKIIGLNDGNATVSIYTVLGKKVVSTSFKATSNNSIKLPNLATGIYVVKLQSENKELNKKIIIE